MRNLLIIVTLVTSFTISNCKRQLDTEFKNISEDEVAEFTSNNALKLFK